MHTHRHQRHIEGRFAHARHAAGPEGLGLDTVVVALAGQPNVGKSTIFNVLTGLTQHVGNWPGKTVEQKTGHHLHQNQDLLFVDLPGTYSLSANSIEERIARDYIIQESPDVVVAVVDAAIPERSLYLLAELLLLPAPVVLVMNMMDVAEQVGILIEPEVLQAALGIPVVPMVATRNEGVERMLDAIMSIVDGTFVYEPRRPTILPDHQEVLAGLIALVTDYVPEPYPVPWVALKLLEGDEEIRAVVEELAPENVRQEIRAILYKHEDAVLDVAGARYAWIGRMVRAAVVRPKVSQVGLTSRLDAVLTHPFWGTLALLAVLAGVFFLTYTVAGPVQGWLVDLLAQFAGGAGSWLSALGSPAWLSDLVSDGLIGGVGTVITFMPILAIFFAALGFLEDTGYMARAAYVTDHFMHVMGLHGKSFLPLLLGFGCNVHAVLVADDPAGPTCAMCGPAGRRDHPGRGSLRQCSWGGGVVAGGAQPGGPGRAGRCAEPFRGKGGAGSLHHGAAALSSTEPAQHRPVRLAEHRGLPAEGRQRDPGGFSGGLVPVLFPGCWGHQPELHGVAGTCY
jgi:ferrous iron transport protein B